jgi:large subunit ribosomal protein L2
MALMTFKPTSPGRRSAVRVVTPGLHKGAPHAALVESQSKSGGRNHHGRITTRHIGGGSKQHYRIVDFKRDKEGIPARVERIEYDPNRTAHIALLCYADGERRYIIAPKGLKAGDQVTSGSDAPIKTGNTLPLRNIPVGSTVHGRADRARGRRRRAAGRTRRRVFDPAPAFRRNASRAVRMPGDDR